MLPAVSFEHVSLAFDDNVVLRDVSCIATHEAMQENGRVVIRPSSPGKADETGSSS